MVPPTHRGVRFGPRGDAVERGPGLVAWWPLIQQLIRIPVTTQSLQISARCMIHDAGDGLIPRVEICALAVQYRVDEAVRAATRCLDLHALVDNRAQAAMARAWAGLDRGSVETAAETARRRLTESLATYGLVVERVDVTHAGLGIAVLSFDSWGYNDDSQGTPRGEKPINEGRPW